MTALQLALYARKAAARGMTLEQYTQLIADDQRRHDELRRLTYDRDTQFAVLARYAAAHGRSFRVHA